MVDREKGGGYRECKREGRWKEDGDGKRDAGFYERKREVEC